MHFLGTGITIPIPLQEPPFTCRPLVSVLPVQKLMKFAGSVADGDCPAAAPPAWPFVLDAA